MAEDPQYSSRLDNKRRFEDQSGATSPSPATSASGRRPTGFSAPIISPTSGAAALSSYNNVPPPPDGIELAKKRAQEIAARIFSVAEAKRPKLESDGGSEDSSNKGFSTDQSLKPMGQSIALQLGGTNSTLSSHVYSGSSKKIEIPNGRVGVIIGRSGETIKYLQVQSGARIQITRDVDADPNSQTRTVELIGTTEQISKAEQLVNEVLSEAESGGSGLSSARKLSTVPANSEHFSMKVPNNKVGLIIGKGGENIRNMQTTCGARIQVIPLHLRPGDPSTERTVHIDGTKEQIELAKQLVNDVISNENRARNPQTGGYHPPRPPTSWVPSGAPQPGYGYMQPGAYPGSAPQYNMSQPPYMGYPPQAQQTAQGTGYDYYNQQQQQQQQLPPPPAQAGGTSIPMDGNTYNYSQIPTAYNGQATYGESTYSQAAVGYQQSYGQVGDYNLAGPQAGYTQPISNPQAAYSSASSYGNTAQSTQEGSNIPNYGVETSTPQAPTGQQPGATTQPGYAVTPTSQPGYASQPSAHANYSQSAPLQPSQAGLAQPAYGHSAQGYSQPPTAPSGYAQDPQQLPPGYVSGVPPAGYGQTSYGGYTQQQTQVYGDAYSGSAFSQPPYSTDGIPTTSAELAPSSGATKGSHQC
ncbi:far upstream element-binding protein 1-like [Phalaenopsis equestris]|uniref:far upstream element-binding protein 1-like n=1 Tax=Phalaenopsis equestris TaxID=78828 RepID=UPI0009E405D7|nr:far upstream element-binding protein 1-like [Phalaenopsis equestris]